MKTAVLFFRFAALVLTACKREGTPDPQISVATATTTRVSVTVTPPDNPLNPLDNVGAFHNRVLDSLKSHIVNVADKSSVGKICYVV